jgi:hypothetical protein
LQLPQPLLLLLLLDLLCCSLSEISKISSQSQACQPKDEI